MTIAQGRSRPAHRPPTVKHRGSRTRISPGQLPLGLADDPAAILRELRGQVEATQKHALLVPEFAVGRGDARIDLAEVSIALKGWEIKGSRDDLRRLPRQADAFSKVFEFATLVAAERHVAACVATVPDWWGVSVVTTEGIAEVRPAVRNPAPSAIAIAGLLWRDEAVILLTELTGVRLRAPRRQLVAEIAACVEPAQLAPAVCALLRQRTSWRAAG